MAGKRPRAAFGSSARHIPRFRGYSEGGAQPAWEQYCRRRIFLPKAVTRRSTRRPSRIAKGGSLIAPQSPASRETIVNFETPEPTLQPGMAERAIDTATAVSRTITDVTAALQAAVDRLSEAVAAARQPGKPLSTISAITREAPLASLFVAFLLGVAVARRR
jgi:hypothetical protein